MAKKSAKKKAVRKATSKKPVSRVTRGVVTFRLTPEEIEKARSCLARSGEIRYAFKELRVTKLPAVLDDGKAID